MPSERPAQRFADILHNIEKTKEYLVFESKADFAGYSRNYDAVAYCFVRLTEAAVKLGPIAEELEPQIEWGLVRCLGNHLRHDYDGVNPEILWKAIQNDFPLLEAACKSAIVKLGARKI